jgi:hypothetical protein
MRSPSFRSQRSDPGARDTAGRFEHGLLRIICRQFGGVTRRACASRAVPSDSTKTGVNFPDAPGAAKFGGYT